MERKEYLKFSSELWDGFEVLSKHTNNEIQFVKDIIKFFKKRAEIEEEYAKNLSRLAQKAQYTSPHGTIRTAWEAVLTEVQNTSGIHTSVVGHLNERVIDTLNNFMRDMESQRKQLVTEGTNLNNEYASTVDHLKKTKSNYEKSCKEAEIAQVTAEKSKTDPLTKPKEREKLEKEAQKKKTTADQLDDDYRKKVDDTNNFMEKYFTEKMPKILGDFEHMETARIQSLKVNLRKYVKLLQEVPPSLTKESEGLSNYVERIHADNDIDQFVNQNKTHQEIPEPFDYEPYQGGNQQARTKPTQKIKRFIIKKAQQVTAVKDAQGGTPASPVMGTSPAATNSPFMPSSPVQRPKTAIFGVTPEEVMEKQRSKFPEDTIPHLLPVLVDAVFRMQGTKTEGIFRIPAGGAELNTVKDRLDHGNYDVITGCTQVYTPCALIKLWLRELPEGLVPSSFYDVCADTPDKGLEVIEQIPALNKQVLVYLINFIQELTKPETVEATKMSTDNLAMVFGPGILRCPYSDYNRVLAAADKQKAFLMYLIQNIPRSETPVWSEAPAALNKSESIAVEEEQQVEEKEKEMDEVPL